MNNSNIPTETSMLVGMSNTKVRGLEQKYKRHAYRLSIVCISAIWIADICMMYVLAPQIPLGLQVKMIFMNIGPSLLSFITYGVIHRIYKHRFIHNSFIIIDHIQQYHRTPQLQSYDNTHQGRGVFSTKKEFSFVEI